jgi:hypothetical protein
MEAKSTATPKKAWRRKATSRHSPRKEGKPITVLAAWQSLAPERHYTINIEGGYYSCSFYYIVLMSWCYKKRRIRLRRQRGSSCLHLLFLILTTRCHASKELLMTIIVNINNNKKL